MKKMIVILSFLCVLLPSALFAEVESWYVYMGLGYSSTSYSGVMDDYTSAYYMDKNYSLNWDMVHFYFPVNNNFIIGPALNFVGDSYKDNYYNETVSIYQYFFGPSCMYFFGKEIGDGFFLRGELGLSRMVISSSDSSETSGSNWGNGYGFLAGIGYGLPVSEGTRLLFTLSYSYKHSTSTDDYALNSSSINFTFGVLW
jgi:hypothetical protein